MVWLKQVSHPRESRPQLENVSKLGGSGSCSADATSGKGSTQRAGQLMVNSGDGLEELRGGIALLGRSLVCNEGGGGGGGGGGGSRAMGM